MKGFTHEDIQTLALDVTDDRAVQLVTRRILAEEGRIDILVNNAGALFGLGENPY